MMAALMCRRWNCPLCTTFAGKNLKVIVRHVGSVHAHDSNFRVCCGVDGCHRTYKKFVSYKKHVYLKHLKTNYVRPLQTEDMDFSNDDISGDIDVSDQRDDRTDVAITLEPLNSKLKISSALLLLKLENEFKLASTSIDCVIEDVTTLLDNKIDFLRTELAAILSQKKIVFDSEINSAFENAVARNPFEGLHTEYFRNKYYRQELHFLEPRETKLGEQYLTSGKMIKDFLYEIPLLSSLELLLSDQFIFDEVFRGHKRSDSLLSDYCDGSLYNSHNLFSKDHTALQLIVYYDDVEVCNPLGSRAKKHKLAIFYYSLAWEYFTSVSVNNESNSAVSSH
jgi:hypothetical protein